MIMRVPWPTARTVEMRRRQHDRCEACAGNLPDDPDTYYYLGGGYALCATCAEADARTFFVRQGER